MTGYWHGKRAIVIGGSAGLGRAVAEALVQRGARVALVARGEEALQQAVEQLTGQGGEVFGVTADVTNDAEVMELADVFADRWDGVDFLCHAAGRSMRGDALTTTIADYYDLWEVNFLATVRVTKVLGELLLASRGHVVLVGSLASKVAPRHLGAYPASKFPLAAWAQQLRLELGPRGLHTMLVCPGPIARPDAGNRYADQSPDVPAAAQQPGGGARLRAIDPHKLAGKILRACERRQAELIVPGRARWLFALAQLSPRLGDWLLARQVESQESRV